MIEKCIVLFDEKVLTDLELVRYLVYIETNHGVISMIKFGEKHCL